MKNVTRVRLQKGLYLVKRGPVWYAETCTRGLQARRSLGTGDLQEAQRRVAQNGMPDAPAPAATKEADAYTLRQAITDYEEWYKRNHRDTGLRRTLPVLELFVDSVGEVTDTRAVTRHHVQRFVDGRADGRSPITVRNDFGRVRAFMRWISAKKEAADWNICRGIEKPKDEEVTRPAPSVEKVRAVLARLRAHAWLGDFCAVLAETGMRPSELLGIRGSDLRGKLLAIVPWEERQLKTKWSKRTIELNVAAHGVLARRVAAMFDKSKAVFATTRPTRTQAQGRVYQERSVIHMFQRELGSGNARKIPESLRMTLYDFRHFFCSEHAAPGPQHMDPEILGAYIGHSPRSIDTLLRWYTDHNALRRGAPAPLTQTGDQGRVLEM